MTGLNQRGNAFQHDTSRIRLWDWPAAKAGRTLESACNSSPICLASTTRFWVPRLTATSIARPSSSVEMYCGQNRLATVKIGVVRPYSRRYIAVLDSVERLNDAGSKHVRGAKGHREQRVFRFAFHTGPHYSSMLSAIGVGAGNVSEGYSWIEAEKCGRGGNCEAVGDSSVSIFGHSRSHRDRRGRRRVL
jgi:hypothetical protein